MIARVFALKQLACVAQGQIGRAWPNGGVIVQVLVLKQLAYEAQGGSAVVVPVTQLKKTTPIEQGLNGRLQADTWVRPSFLSRPGECKAWLNKGISGLHAERGHRAEPINATPPSAKSSLCPTPC